MKLLQKAKDGGPKSTVTGYWLIEIKSLFSIVLLRFDVGTREAYHSHAFNAVTWFLRGEVKEYLYDGSPSSFPWQVWRPSLWPKWTPRSCFHKVYAQRRTWALSFRGPWAKQWDEYIPLRNERQTLTHGRKVVDRRVAFK